MAKAIRHIHGRGTLVAGRYPLIAGGAPEDEEQNEFAQFDNEQLQAQLDEAIQQFDAIAALDAVSEEQMQELRDKTARIEAIKAEQEARQASAEAAQAEIEAMQKRIKGEQKEEEQAEEESTEDDSTEDDGEGESTTETPEEQAEEEAPAIAASARARTIPLAQIRARQKKQPTPKDAPKRGKVVITASADVPGIDTGAEIDIVQLTDAAMARARGIATKSGRPRHKAQVASYRIPFDKHLQVDSDGNASEGTMALVAAADQSRLPGGDLVASGGWCAPSETVYDIADIACPDMLWSPPEIQLRRGGIRYVPTPSLVVSDLSGVWTEADDIAALEDQDLVKEAFHVPCPEFQEVRCDAIYAWIEAGILTERAYPELVSWYTRNAMVAHEIVVKRRAFLQAIGHEFTQQITVDASFGAFTAIFGAVALQAADLVEKHSLCESINVEVTFPWWAKNLFLADIARQNGRSMAEVSSAVLARPFNEIGVQVGFARGLAPDVPTNIGGTDVPAGWPSTVPFLINPAGAFQIGRGDTVDLGVVQDSEKFKHNDFTALFTEECVTLVARGPEARFVTVPVCPDGVTGGQAATDADINCPLDGGPAGS